MAVFLNLSLQDTSTEHAVVTPPALVNKPLPQLICDGNAPVKNAVPPAMRSKISQKGAGIEIVFPPPGLGVLWLPIIGILFIGIPILITPFGKVLALTIHEQGFNWVIVFSIILFIPLSILAGYTLFALLARTTVTVNTDGITIAEGKVLYTKRTVLASHDIIGIDCAKYSGITVKTHRGLLAFADYSDLSYEEVEYLYSLVVHTLTAHV